MWQPGRTLEEMEKEVILTAMRFYHGNKTHTASALGIAIRTLDNKLAKYRGEPVNEETSVEVEAKEAAVPSVQKRKKSKESQATR